MDQLRIVQGTEAHVELLAKLNKELKFGTRRGGKLRLRRLGTRSAAESERV